MLSLFGRAYAQEPSAGPDRGAADARAPDIAAADARAPDLAAPDIAAPDIVAADIATADAAFEAGELGSALAGYEGLLERGGLEHARYVHVVTRIMLVRSARRDEAGTRSAARRFLAVPGLALPSEMSRLARGWVESERSAVTPHTVLAHEPLERSGSAWVARVRVRVGAPGMRVALHDGTRPLGAAMAIDEPGERWLALSLPEAPTGLAEVLFLDEHDNRVASIPIVLERAPTPAPAPTLARAPGQEESAGGPGVLAAEEEPGRSLPPAPSRAPRHGSGDLALSGAVIAGVGLASFAGFFTATAVGWDAFGRCESPDCEPYLDWTPELADVSLGVSVLGAALLLAGILSESPHTDTARGAGAIRW
jgi:hypothetical protein